MASVPARSEAGVKRFPRIPQLAEAVREILTLNPDFGLRRVMRALEERYPDWRVDERKVRRLVKESKARPPELGQGFGGMPPPAAGAGASFEKALGSGGRQAATGGGNGGKASGKGGKGGAKQGKGDPRGGGEVDEGDDKFVARGFAPSDTGGVFPEDVVTLRRRGGRTKAGGQWVGLVKRVAGFVGEQDDPDEVRT